MFRSGHVFSSLTSCCPSEELKEFSDSRFLLSFEQYRFELIFQHLMEIRAFHQSFAEIILFIEEQVVEERLQRFARGIDFKHDLKIGLYR